MVRIIFVCTGNICRSPTAEGIARVLVARAGLSSLIEIDSAGRMRITKGSRRIRASGKWLRATVTIYREYVRDE